MSKKYSLMKEAMIFQDMGITVTVNGKNLKEISAGVSVLSGNTPYMKDFSTNDNGCIESVDYQSIKNSTKM